MKRAVLILIISSFLGACAQDSNSIEAHYVSPMEYRGYNCQQLEIEMVQTSNRAKRLVGQIDERASQDAVAVAGGFLVSWPIFFFIQGDSPKAMHYARLKGDFQALEMASDQKNCAIEVNKYTLKEV